MKRSIPWPPGISRRPFASVAAAGWFALTAVPAHASLFHGETLDALANGISWVVIIIAPVIGITIFWLVHILPEKIAEKKQHPQAKAIQCLCLLSLCFGGLLWPLAWLWAYTKPVLHKLAYGTDVDPSHGGAGHAAKGQAAATHPDDEVRRLRERLAQLENQAASKKGGRV